MSIKEIALPEGVQIQTFGAPWDNKPILLAPLEDGAVVSAWSSDDTSYLTIVESNGAVRHIGSLEGPDVHGLAAIDDEIAVLVRRDDALYAVLMNTDGAVLREQRLIGEVPQEIVGNKWTNAGNEARIASADDRYVVYAGHMQRWPDNIGHQGDLLWRPPSQRENSGPSGGCLGA